MDVQILVRRSVRDDADRVAQLMGDRARPAAAGRLGARLVHAAHKPRYQPNGRALVET